MPTQIVLEPVTDAETQLAPLYRVLIHNDDVTSMGFVLHILGEVFHLDLARSRDIMMEAHTSGVALVVVEPFEDAKLHVEQSRSLARPRGYPLTLTLEPEE